MLQKNISGEYTLCEKFQLYFLFFVFVLYLFLYLAGGLIFMLGGSLTKMEGGGKGSTTVIPPLSSGSTLGQGGGILYRVRDTLTSLERSPPSPPSALVPGAARGKVESGLIRAFRFGEALPLILLPPPRRVHRPSRGGTWIWSDSLHPFW